MKLTPGPSSLHGLRVERHQPDNRSQQSRSRTEACPDLNLHRLAISPLSHLEDDPHRLRVLEQRQRAQRDCLAVQFGRCRTHLSFSHPLQFGC